MELEGLGLWNNNITDLSPLEGMESLMYIYLDGNSELTCLEDAGWELDYYSLELYCPFDELDTDGDGLADSIDEELSRSRSELNRRAISSSMENLPGPTAKIETAAEK